MSEPITAFLIMALWGLISGLCGYALGCLRASRGGGS